jgi:hypothetical protein
MLLPKGFTPISEKEGSFDPEKGVLIISVAEPKGQVHLSADGISEDAVIEAVLIDQDQNTLATASLTIPLHEQFELGPQGGEIAALDGKLKVKFPKDALTEQTVIEIGSPAGDSVPIYSLSGRPFEIKARTKGDGTEIKHFGQEIEFEIPLDDLNIPPGAEQDVHLYWYNPELKAWEGLPSAVHAQKHVLRAFTGHFSLFDIGINHWQEAHPPTIDSFQVANFTGAATFSLPVEVPAGPGGLQPNLTLNYNSQVVDQSSNKTQPSWVGMGWSLDTGSIERDTHGTTEDTTDDTFLLSVNGMSDRVILDSSGAYHTIDEKFWRITYDSASNRWTVWDKQGNVYYFEYAIRMG